MNTQLRAFLLVQAAIVLVTAAPLLAIGAASAIAAMTGCSLDESTQHACLVVGVDIGAGLTTLFVAGWLMFVTLPLGALMWFAHIVYGGIQLLRRPAKPR